MNTLIKIEKGPGAHFDLKSNEESCLSICSLNYGLTLYLLDFKALYPWDGAIDVYLHRCVLNVPLIYSIEIVIVKVAASLYSARLLRQLVNHEKIMCFYE